MVAMADLITAILAIIITTRTIIITTVLSPKIIHSHTGSTAVARLITIGITMTNIKTEAVGKIATINNL
jgi:hypothetical protein